MAHPEDNSSLDQVVSEIRNHEYGRGRASRDPEVASLSLAITEAKAEAAAIQKQFDDHMATHQPEPEPEPVSVMLMGVSSSPHDQGGTNEWDVWRVYTRGEMLQRANQTGAARPKALAYSEDGPPMSGTYDQVKAHVIDELNDFYYTTGDTRSSRWGIKLFWSNGNEMHDKGMLALPHTATGISRFVQSQRGLYDAVMTLNPDGSRRFPDAYAGSNPTTEAERQGWIEDWTGPSAQYHHFQMWSMYPAGRKDTVSDPTFNWPSFDEADWDNAPQGWLIRCFRRTAAHGIPMISIGETGIGNDPDDSTTRPYYAVHGLAHSFQRLADQYDLEIPFACWWDNELNGGPQNILSDEQAGTNPSTRQAWQNWRSYCHLRGGTHPASWAGNPKSAWKTTGTPPTA